MKIYQQVGLTWNDLVSFKWSGEFSKHLGGFPLASGSSLVQISSITLVVGKSSLFKAKRRRLKPFVRTRDWSKWSATVSQIFFFHFTLQYPEMKIMEPIQGRTLSFVQRLLKYTDKMVDSMRRGVQTSEKRARISDKGIQGSASGHARKC
jgi:hypothetical protein